MHALITGGAGFIGSHLADLQLARGDSVHVVDDLSTGARSNTGQHEDNPNFRFDEDDVHGWIALDDHSDGNTRHMVGFDWRHASWRGPKASPDWKRASDVGAVLTVCILSHWQLVGSIGYSERIKEYGRYDGTIAGLTLRYRL